MKLCRGCLDDTKTNLQPLVATDEIFDLFNDLTKLNIYLNDGLPNWLCKRCISRLTKFKEFREQCTSSSIELKLKLAEGGMPEIATVFVDSDELKLEIEGSSRMGDHDLDESNRMEFEMDAENGKSQIKGENDVADTSKPLFIKVRKKKNSSKSQKKEYQKNQSFAYRCDECGRGFHYRERYEGHLREHAGKSAAVCEFCNGEYTGWSGLQKHMALMHEAEMKYVCDECGKKFIYESGLIAHRSTHFGPRKHMCEECGRAFINTYALSKHKLSHTDETPFNCSICAKQFKCEAHLKAHRFRHMGIKKFSCDSCGKSFTTRPELKQHMRVHSDIKEFQCTFCHQYFKQKSQLSVHQKSHAFS